MVDGEVWLTTGDDGVQGRVAVPYSELSEAALGILVARAFAEDGETEWARMLAASGRLDELDAFREGRQLTPEVAEALDRLVSQRKNLSKPPPRNT